MVSAAADVIHFNAQITRQLVLNTDVEAIGETRHQGMRIYRDKTKNIAGINVLISWLQDSRVPAVPIERCVDVIDALEPGSKTVGHTVEIGFAGRQERQGKGASQYQFITRRIGKADLRPKAVMIFLFFEAVSAPGSENQFSGPSIGRINLGQVVICPVPVLLVILPGVLPS